MKQQQQEETNRKLPRDTVTAQLQTSSSEDTYVPSRSTSSAPMSPLTELESAEKTTGNEDNSTDSEREPCIIVALNAPKRSKREKSVYKVKGNLDSTLSLSDIDVEMEQDLGNEAEDEKSGTEHEERPKYDQGKEVDIWSNEYSTVETTEFLMNTECQAYTGSNESSMGE